MLVRSLVVVAITWLVGCSSSGKPLDCYKVAPSDCEKYSQCRTIAVSRHDERCMKDIVLPVACWPEDVPGCQMVFYLEDPSGQCWGTGECFVPQGWQVDDGSCREGQLAIYNACHPQDSGATLDGR